MSELEIALIGLLILLGAATIVYAGTRPARRKSDTTTASGDPGAPVMAGKHADANDPGDAAAADGGGAD